MTTTTLSSVYHTLLEVSHSTIRDFSLARLPEEAVGLLTDEGSIYPLINQRRSADEFMVSRLLVGEAISSLRAQDLIPVALLHSHPTRSAKPSPSDRTMMAEIPTTTWVIYSIPNDTSIAYSWDESNGKVVELTRHRGDRYG